MLTEVIRPVVSVDTYFCNAKVPPSPEVVDYEKQMLNSERGIETEIASSLIMLEVVAGDLAFSDVESLLEQTDDVVPQIESDPFSELTRLSAYEFIDLLQEPIIENAARCSDVKTPSLIERTAAQMHSVHAAEKVIRRRAGIREKLVSNRRKLGAVLLAGVMSITAACGRSAPSEESSDSTTTTVEFVTEVAQNAIESSSIPRDLPEGAVPIVLIDGSENEETPTSLPQITTPSSSAPITPSEEATGAAGAPGSNTINPTALEGPYACTDIIFPNEGITDSMQRFASYAQSVGLIKDDIEFTPDLLWARYIKIDPVIRGSAMVGNGLYTAERDVRISETGQITYNSEVCSAMYDSLLEE